MLRVFGTFGTGFGPETGVVIVTTELIVVDEEVGSPEVRFEFSVYGDELFADEPPGIESEGLIDFFWNKFGYVEAFVYICVHGVKVVIFFEHKNGQTRKGEGVYICSMKCVKCNNDCVGRHTMTSTTNCSGYFCPICDAYQPSVIGYGDIKIVLSKEQTDQYIREQQMRKQLAETGLRENLIKLKTRQQNELWYNSKQ